jgi:hypothetical protein
VRGNEPCIIAAVLVSAKPVGKAAKPVGKAPRKPAKKAKKKKK